MVAKTFWSVLGCSLLLTGCQVIATQQSVEDEAPDNGKTFLSEEEIVTTEAARRTENPPQASVESNADTLVKPKTTAPVEPEPSPEQVVIKLQQQALQLQSEGRWSDAELILARALRIDANKVDIYHQMATVRMGQQRFAEAEQIALKGLTLTNQTADHKAMLWQVIAQCRSALSDVKGAREARAEMLKWMDQ